MGRFPLSRRAEDDLYRIGQYTLRRWGPSQAARYLRELEAYCQRLADNPGLGRPCDDIRRGLRRMQQGKHVVFYREGLGGVFISRILHGRMLPENQVIDGQDDDSTFQQRRAGGRFGRAGLWGYLSR